MPKTVKYALSLLVALALVWNALVAKTGGRGWVRVAPHQVAVVSDYVRGTTKVVDAPGVRWFVPYFQDVHVLDKSPARLRMRDGESSSASGEPALTVRAADGTSFSFEDLTLIYGLAPAQAAAVLADTGEDPAARFFLVRSLARGVLRDELGRYTVEEIVRGDVLDAARAAARERLNARLAPHGVFFSEVPAALPRFDADYEQQVLRRRVAEQQVTLVRAERQKLVRQLDQRRIQVQREKEVERDVLVGDLAKLRLDAETEAIQRRREADIAYLERVEAARVMRLDLEQQARSLRERYESEAEGFAERVRAVTSGGEQTVREAWVEALGQIEFELAPYELERPARSGAGGSR